MKNLMDMMKQAKQLQEKMQDMQASVEAISETGTSGAGLVSVTLNGKGMLSAVRIDPSLMKEGEGEILEDLIVAAHADAKSKIEATLQTKMQELTGGLQLPPGMKLF
jgi:DNA-binding YbaB/EbfC family protein